MAKENFNPYSRCGCCDAVLGSNQPILRSTGKVDDLCSSCRHAVNKAVHYHAADVEELENDVWRTPLGGHGNELIGGVTPPLPSMDGQ